MPLLKMCHAANNTQAEVSKSVVVIVAHPDDETLWAGGLILKNSDWKFYIICLCRKNDAERAPRFYKTLQVLNADGVMADLDDGPDQEPLDKKMLEETILQLLPPRHFDLVITHNAHGEYTRHLRHEEISACVTALWKAGKISAPELWTFAYEDGHKKYYPKAIVSAVLFLTLAKEIWDKKYAIITGVYGFAADSWEAKTTPVAEAFRKYTDKK